MDENAGSKAKPEMTAEEIRKRVGARAAAEAAELAAAGKGPLAGFGRCVDDAFVRDCLYAEELGDGILFAVIHERRFRFNASSQSWLVWNGLFWRDDLHNEHLAGVEQVAEIYHGFAMRCAEKIQAATASQVPAEKVAAAAERDRKKALKRVRRLQTDKGRVATVKLSRSNGQASLSVAGEAFDKDPWLLVTSNAALDLRLGEPVEAKPEAYCSKACPVEWQGIDCPAPLWGRFLLEVFESNLELVGFLQRLLGYCIYGAVREHVFPVLYGMGRNGKGSIVEVMKLILGDYCGPVQAELFLDQGKARSSAAPSPDIMELKGRRLVYAEEPDAGRRLSVGRVKWLCGGGTLTGRWPHDRRNVSFAPTHKTLLLTNHKPPAGPDEFAFWERAVLIPFRLAFVDREPVANNERRADLGLFEKLRGEASGILAWVVRGCLEWQRVGLAPPPIVTEATLEYRAEDDFLTEWISERCEISPELQERCKALFEDFRVWFEDNWSAKCPSAIRFRKMLRGRFKTDRDSGNYCIFLGIALAKGVGVA